MDDFEKEDEVLERIESHEFVENARIDDREPVEDDYGMNDGYTAVLVISFTDDFVETVREEQGGERDAWSDTLNGFTNTLELEWDISPSDYRLYEETSDPVLDVGEMYAFYRVKD